MSVDVELYGRFGWCMFGRFGWCMFSSFGLKIMEEPAPGFPPYMRGSIGSSLGPPAVHMTPPCTKRPPKVHPAQAKAKPVKKPVFPPMVTVRCKSPSPVQGLGNLILGFLNVEMWISSRVGHVLYAYSIIVSRGSAWTCLQTWNTLL